MTAYAANRKAAIHDAIESDCVAACVREIMAERSVWTGTATDLLRLVGDRGAELILPAAAVDWPKTPRSFAGRLRRAQVFLRTLGIDISFGREGHAGERIIRMQANRENSFSTLTTIRNDHAEIASARTSKQRSAVSSS